MDIVLYRVTGGRGGSIIHAFYISPRLGFWPSRAHCCYYILYRYVYRVFEMYETLLHIIGTQVSFHNLRILQCIHYIVIFLIDFIRHTYSLFNINIILSSSLYARDDIDIVSSSLHNIYYIRPTSGCGFSHVDRYL